MEIERIASLACDLDPGQTIPQRLSLHDEFLRDFLLCCPVENNHTRIGGHDCQIDLLHVLEIDKQHRPRHLFLRLRGVHWLLWYCVASRVGIVSPAAEDRSAPDVSPHRCGDEHRTESGFRSNTERLPSL